MGTLSELLSPFVASKQEECSATLKNSSNSSRAVTVPASPLPPSTLFFKDMDPWSLMVSSVNMATSALTTTAGRSGDNSPEKTRMSKPTMHVASKRPVQQVERERSAKEIASEMIEAEQKAKARADAAAKAAAATKAKLEAKVLAQKAEAKLKEAEGAMEAASAAEATALALGVKTAVISENNDTPVSIVTEDQKRAL